MKKRNLLFSLAAVTAAIAVLVGTNVGLNGPGTAGPAEAATFTTNVAMAVDFSGDGVVTDPPQTTGSYSVGSTLTVEVEVYNIPSSPGAKNLQVVLNSYVDGSDDLVEPTGWVIDPNGTIAAQTGQACQTTGATITEVETTTDTYDDQVGVPCFFTGTYSAFDGDHVAATVDYDVLDVGATTFDLETTGFFVCKIDAYDGSGNLLAEDNDGSGTGTVPPTATPSPTPTPLPAGPVVVKDIIPLTEDVDDLANLWICEADSPSCTGFGEGGITISELLYFDDPSLGAGWEGIGAFEIQIKFDHKVFEIDVDLTPGQDFLESTGRSATCMSEVYENFIFAGCATSDYGMGIDGPQEATPEVLAEVNVTYDNDMKYRLRPSCNGEVRVLLDENCEVADIWGQPVPGSVDGGLAVVCADAALTVRILQGDIDLDCSVFLSDAMEIAYRYGAPFGHILYDPWFDLEPCFTDFDIDIKDVQYVAGRIMSTCSDPYPDQDPLEPPQGW